MNMFAQTKGPGEGTLPKGTSRGRAGTVPPYSHSLGEHGRVQSETATLGRSSDARRECPETGPHLSTICRSSIFFLLIGIALCPRAQAVTEEEYLRQRQEMVRDQIQGRGVQDPAVLTAMRNIPRHRFVPSAVRHLSYQDHPLPIGEGQTISQPYIVALMTELAEVKKGEKVLEIGTGSGYQAAILGELTDPVFTIEIVPTLGAQAQKTLQELGYTQVQVRIGDGYLGWPEEAPFDAILVTAAPDHVPQPLVDQLAEEGVLVIPVGKQGTIQELQRLKKKGGKVTVEKIIPVTFVPLIRERAAVE